VFKRDENYYMKILIAGDWRWSIYEKAFSQALSELGHHVTSFVFSKFLKGRIGHYTSAIPIPGPALLKINSHLLNKAKVDQPDVILVWRGTHVLPIIIKKLNRAGFHTVSYNNDDPFGPIVHGNVPWHHHFLWYWYRRSLKYYQQNFFYREVNVKEARQYGVYKGRVLKPYFIPEKDKPFELSEYDKERFSCDVVFIGHYEPDGREKYISALVNGGLHVRLFGGHYWTKEVLGDLSSYFDDVYPVYGEDYTKALCSAKICLSFLSKLNRDTYTRRCFEIPACGCLLLCERTDDLKEMFVEGEEAVFFSSKEELVEKALWLVNHEDEIKRIAVAGKNRVWKDGHDVKSRAAEFLSMLDRMKNGQ
jgi:spore maturation protein CgeB